MVILNVDLERCSVKGSTAATSPLCHHHAADHSEREEADRQQDSETREIITDRTSTLKQR